MLPQRPMRRKRKLRTDVAPYRLYTFRPQFATTSLPARGRAPGPARLLSWLAQNAVGALVLEGLAFRTADVARVLGVAPRTCRAYLNALEKAGYVRVLRAGHVGLRVTLCAAVQGTLFGSARGPRAKMPRSGVSCIRARRRGESEPTLTYGEHGRAVRHGRRRSPMPGQPHPSKGYLVASPQARRTVLAAAQRYARGAGKHLTGEARLYAQERTLNDVARAEAAGRSFTNLYGFAITRLDSYACKFNAEKAEREHRHVRVTLQTERAAHAPVAPPTRALPSYSRILADIVRTGVKLPDARVLAKAEYDRLATAAASPFAGSDELPGGPRNASSFRPSSPARARPRGGR